MWTINILSDLFVALYFVVFALLINQWYLSLKLVDKSTDCLQVENLTFTFNCHFACCLLKMVQLIDIPVSCHYLYGRPLNISILFQEDNAHIHRT